MTTRAADKIGILAFFGYALLALVFAVVAAKYFIADKLFFGVALGAVAVALAVLAGLWVGSATSEVTIDDTGIRRLDGAGFEFAWSELDDARVERIGGWPHLVVKPAVASKKRTVGQVVLGWQGMAKDALGAPIAVADVDAVSHRLAGKPWLAAASSRLIDVVDDGPVDAAASPA